MTGTKFPGICSPTCVLLVYEYAASGSAPAGSGSNTEAEGLHFPSVLSSCITAPEVSADESRHDCKGFGLKTKGEVEVEETEHHAGFCTPICAVAAKPDEVPANATKADEGLHCQTTSKIICGALSITLAVSDNGRVELPLEWKTTMSSDYSELNSKLAPDMRSAKNGLIKVAWLMR